MKISWKQVGMYGAAGALIAVVGNLIANPDTIDWVNVALIPELAEELGADLTTRLELANIGYLALDAIKGPPGTPTPAGKQADAYGRTALETSGQQAFDLLTVEQRKRFLDMFRSRELVPVTYRTEPPPSGSGPAMFRVEFGWKKINTSMHISLPDTADQLGRVYEIILSKTIAESLVDHSSVAVSLAATKWLNEHAPPRKKERRLSGPYSEDKWERLDRKMAEIRRDHESKFVDPRRDRESQTQAGDTRPSHEERVAEVKRKRRTSCPEKPRRAARSQMKKKN